jgi:hypothetical protein
MFPNLTPDDLDIRDSMVFEKENPANRKTIREVADEFWALIPRFFIHLQAPYMDLLWMENPILISMLWQGSPFYRG